MSTTDWMIKNSTLQNAWYIRHVRWACLFYIWLIIWSCIQGSEKWRQLLLTVTKHGNGHCRNGWGWYYIHYNQRLVVELQCKDAYGRTRTARRGRHRRDTLHAPTRSAAWRSRRQCNGCNGCNGWQIAPKNLVRIHTSCNPFRTAREIRVGESSSSGASPYSRVRKSHASRCCCVERSAGKPGICYAWQLVAGEDDRRHWPVWLGAKLLGIRVRYVFVYVLLRGGIIIRTHDGPKNHIKYKYTPMF